MLISKSDSTAIIRRTYVRHVGQIIYCRELPSHLPSPECRSSITVPQEILPKDGCDQLNLSIIRAKLSRAPFLKITWMVQTVRDFRSVSRSLGLFSNISSPLSLAFEQTLNASSSLPLTPNNGPVPPFHQFDKIPRS